jgi:geranylgeranyl transferase type-2 subunit alpha
LCAKLHALDSRNFHCWNYRRWLVGVACADDLAYTRQRINDDFSNYSAWHARSVALAHTSLVVTGVGGDEWDLVLHAMYTGPQDQSVWMYVLWLLQHRTHADELAQVCTRLAHACVELLGLDGESQSKWVLLLLLRLIDMNPTGTLQLPPAPHDTRQGLLEALIRVDPMRKRCFEDIFKQ